MRLSHLPRRPVLVSSVAAALWLAGCTSPPKAVPAAPGAVDGSAPGPAYGRPAPGSSPWSPAMEACKDRLESRLKGTGASVARSTDDRLWITLPGDASFDANRSALKPAARAVLDQVVMNTRALGDIEVRIVGHTDAKGSAAANNALSLDRAASTRDWLVARGVSPVKVSVAGRGAQDPIASNDTETGRAANRRVELLIAQRGAVTPPAGR